MSRGSSSRFVIVVFPDYTRLPFNGLTRGRDCNAKENGHIDLLSYHYFILLRADYLRLGRSLMNHAIRISDHVVFKQKIPAHSGQHRWTK